MDKLRFSIVIGAPRKKVWDTMLGADSYRVWTDVFMPGSYYVGDWSKGSKMLFLGPGEKGGMYGMVSRTKENRPYEYISIEHTGLVQDGKEDTTSAAAKEWAGVLENYAFREKEGATEVLVDVDTTDQDKEMFQNIWPKALQKLKELAEK